MSTTAAPVAAQRLRATVPRLWPDATIICIGSGPSLTQPDVTRCLMYCDAPERNAHLVVINDAWRLAPAADLLYAADSKWWRWNADIPDNQLPPRLYTIDPHAVHWRPSVHVLNWSGHRGLDLSPDSLRTGGHGGYQAINLAVHLGAKQILLLGYDMQPAPDGRNHFFGEHPDGNHPKYAHRLSSYLTLVEPLATANIRVINISRRTAITAFPCAPLESLIP